MSGRKYKLRQGAPDQGFTLVEVVVAMGLIAVVMTAALPALLGAMKSTVLARTTTQAKNISQERLDQLRNLRFHVDRQNGPFLDLLDIYYTNSKTIGAVTTVTSGGVTLKGRFVASGGGTGGEPAAPYYRVEATSLPAAAGFKQVISTQFLTPTGVPVAAASFQDVYDSQVVGKDQAPTLLLGVTVITKWTSGGNAHSYRTYTRITDGRPQLPLIQTQAQVVAVGISSTALDGSTLKLQGGVVSLDGSQSSGSSVAGFVTGALATRSGAAAVTGRFDEFELPNTSMATTGSASATTSCSWFGYGNSGTANVGGDVTSGLPKAPVDVADAVPPNFLSGYIEHSGAPLCGQMSFDNLIGGGVARGGGPGVAMGAPPYVRVNNTSGSGPSIVGSGYVTSNDDTATTPTSKAGVRAATGSSVIVFPNSPESGGAGLLKLNLVAAQVDCLSGTGGVAGSAAASYELKVEWWGRVASEAPRWHQARWLYSSVTGAPQLQAGSENWNPSQTFMSDGSKLSDLITLSAASGSPEAITSGAANGLRGFPTGILTVSTAATLAIELAPGYSAINVAVGQLTCVADDQR